MSCELNQNHVAAHLSTEGSDSCTSGSLVSEAECLASAQSALPSDASQGRTSLISGSWGFVPFGCSVQSSGDWVSDIGVPYYLCDLFCSGSLQH